jgi:aldose 1-epimerase
MTLATHSTSSRSSRRTAHGAPQPPAAASPLRSVRTVPAFADAESITLSNPMLRLDLAPALGGGITRFDWRADAEPLPIFRRCETPGADTDPNQLACYPLLPYANRIGGGSFSFSGRAVNVPRNRVSEPLPIHGDGWLHAWHIQHASKERACITLDRSNGAPYAYRAVQIFRLDGATLHIEVQVENAGHEALPFGLGMHPFLTRDVDTELSAPAGGLWLSGDDWLPVRHVSAPPAWQFGVAYPLPATLVNHAFTGWGGRTSVSWPKRRLSLSIEADTDCYVLYVPPGKDYFCFEPVDHPINAVNLPGGGAAHGMTVLAPGERLARQFSFTVERCGGLSPCAGQPPGKDAGL